MRKKLGYLVIICLLSCFFIGCGAKKVPIGTVTLSIRCDTAIAKGMHEEEKWKGILPENGCILDDTTIEIYKGDTVFDVLLTARDEYGIHMEYSGGDKTEYIKGIGNLYERDGGRWSGWMFSVNGEYGDVGCGQVKVGDGDIIEWDYTCDLGVDLESSSTVSTE